MNETLKTIHSLRTTHGNFDPQEISDQDLQTIIEASVRAASASARQGYSIVVIQDREVMKQLCGYAGSKALLFCADCTRIVDTAAHLGYAADVEGINSFVVCGIDTILAAQTAAIAARSLGIDSLFTNGIHRGDMTRVYRLLDLPERYCFPLIMLVLGYADQEPAYLKGRLNGPGVIHWGKYHRLSKAELGDVIAQYDDPGLHLGLNDAWQQESMAHYLDWFFTRWAVRGAPRTGKSQMFEIFVNYRP